MLGPFIGFSRLHVCTAQHGPAACNCGAICALACTLNLLRLIQRSLASQYSPRHDGCPADEQLWVFSCLETDVAVRLIPQQQNPYLLGVASSCAHTAKPCPPAGRPRPPPGPCAAGGMSESALHQAAAKGRQVKGAGLERAGFPREAEAWEKERKGEGLK